MPLAVKEISYAVRHINGDRDPISAGSVGEAVCGGGSMAVKGMSANPIGALQVCRDMADRRVIRFAARSELVGRAVAFK